MKETQSQFKLPGVPQAKQGREVPQQWDWTEASVWTERMLETLERGIKGGKWFSLMDKVWKRENLQSALKTVVQNKGAAGVDGKQAEQYLRESPHRLEQVQDMLRKGQYTPQPVKRVWIPKLGSKELRPLGVPAEQYLQEGPHRLEQVQDMLRKGQYTPQPVKRVWIPKLGSKELRPLGVP